MKIGIFDSGIGGLTVLKEALKQLPHEEYIYFADTFHAPYGTKNENVVKGFIDEIVEFLYQQKIDALVIACNTATSIGVKELRKKYNFPIIGMEPAVKVALQSNPSKRILVLATPLTIKGSKYKDLLDRVDAGTRVDSLALPMLVEYAENNIFDSEVIESYLNQEFSLYDLENYAAIVLGCTHFVYFKDIISQMVSKDIVIVDGNEGTIRHLKKVLMDQTQTQDSCQHGSITYYQSTERGVDQTDYSNYMGENK